MAHQKKELTEKERKTRAVLLRPRLRFEPKSPDQALKERDTHEKAWLARHKPGDRMKDGTVFAGISPDTNKPLYTAPADSPKSMKFGEAVAYIAALNRHHHHGHQDWRVPTIGELKLLFNQRAAIGGFDERGHAHNGWYWSSTPEPSGHDAYQAVRFQDGWFCWFHDYDTISLRCVRGTIPPQHKK